VINLRAQSQTSRKFEHIQGLTAGIGITAELQILRTKQTMQVQMQQTKAHFFHQSQTTNGRLPTPFVVSKGGKRIEK
jgi:hypothetical protein